MSLYPSLEDMKVDQLSQAQHKLLPQQSNLATIPQQPSQYTAPYPYQPQYSPETGTNPPQYQPYGNGMAAASPQHYHSQGVYPALGEYMGMELTEALISENMPEYLAVTRTVVTDIIPSGLNTNLIAPLSGQSLGLQKAQVTHGIRQLTLCKDKDNKVGVRVKAINNGIFVCLVIDKSPAALAGLRFGDQILQVNGVNVAGYTMDKVHTLFRKSPVNGIQVAVRDRPFERTITLHKDSAKCIGFQFKNGKIVSIVKDSSAARNGVLTDHQLLEVDGQNVVGLKDKAVGKIIDGAGDVVTITVIPSFMYDHMVKKMAGSILKDLMDHSIPTL